MPLITSEINYDEEANVISKAYDNGMAFSVAYDDKGNIISNERNSYTYDAYGELIQTTGAVNSSYTYDGRGNLLTKTVNGETTEFEYNNEWLDQLTSVNGVSLTYDVNGNLLTKRETVYSYENAEFYISKDKTNLWLFLLNKETQNGIDKYCVCNYQDCIYLDKEWTDIQNFRYCVVDDKDILENQAFIP